MTCEQLSSRLVAYHFGELGEAERDEIEGHLLGCPGCCRSYVVVKREIEIAPRAPRPSDAARARLRKAVAAELRRSTRRDRWWWERPLAVACAAAAVAIAMQTTHALATTPARGPRSLPAQAR